MQHTQHTKNHGYENLAVLSVTKTRAGAVKTVTEYLDMATGEVISAASVPMTPLDLRTKYADKEAALDSLRPEVYEFALFVLGYANKRRGIAPSINTLCQWYAKLHGKRADNIRRYIPKLEAAGILAGESLLGPLWQRTGGTARSHLGEDTAAELRYMLQRARQTHGLDRKGCPAWLDAAMPTGNLMNQEIYSDLMSRIGKRMPCGATLL